MFKSVRTVVALVMSDIAVRIIKRGSDYGVLFIAKGHEVFVPFCNMTFSDDAKLLLSNSVLGTYEPEKPKRSGWYVGRWGKDLSVLPNTTYQYVFPGTILPIWIADDGKAYLMPLSPSNGTSGLTPFTTEDRLDVYFSELKKMEDRPLWTKFCLLGTTLPSSAHPVGDTVASGSIVVGYTMDGQYLLFNPSWTKGGFITPPALKYGSFVYGATHQHLLVSSASVRG